MFENNKMKQNDNDTTKSEMKLPTNPPDSTTTTLNHDDDDTTVNKNSADKNGDERNDKKRSLRVQKTASSCSTSPSPPSLGTMMMKRSKPRTTNPNDLDENHNPFDPVSSSSYKASSATATTSSSSSSSNSMDLSQEPESFHLQQHSQESETHQHQQEEQQLQQEEPQQQEEQVGVEGGQEHEQDPQWTKFLETATPEDAPNLTDYLRVKGAREVAERNFGAGLDDCMSGLQASLIDDLFSETVVAIHQQHVERFDLAELDIITTMKSNHCRRKDLLTQMEDANTTWQSRYSDIVQYIHTLNVPPHKKQQQRQESPTLCKTGKGSSPREKRNGRDIAINGDPDWEELAEFESTRGNIDRFLKARDKMQQANELLSQALDEIHEGLKVEVDSIVEIIVDLHDHHANRILATEADIQFHLMQNCKRQTALHLRLEESAKQAQGMFANLLSRLRRG